MYAICVYAACSLYRVENFMHVNCILYYIQPYYLCKPLFLYVYLPVALSCALWIQRD